MHARHTVYAGLPSGEVAERARAVIRDLEPWMSEFDGFHGIVLLADEDGGRCVAITLWDDEAALRRSEAAVGRMRVSIAELMSASIEEATPCAVAHWTTTQARY